MNDYLLERRIAELEYTVKLLIEEVNKLKNAGITKRIKR